MNNLDISFSEILLFLEFIQMEKRLPKREELFMVLYFSNNYSEVKDILQILNEMGYKYSNKDYLHIIHFIEEFSDCRDLVNKILKKTKKPASQFFIQLILLSKNEQQALEIWEESRKYGVNLGEVWLQRYDNIKAIKNDQLVWRENVRYRYGNVFISMYKEFLEKKKKYFNNFSAESLKDAIVNKETGSQKIYHSKSKVYARSIYVKEFAKKVANGICQLCENKAPFYDKFGEPYLEVHHIKYLSAGGSDTIDNVIALCPNCHRKMHVLELEEDVNKLIRKAKEYANM